MTAVRSTAIFAAAAAFELGGTYAVWRWLRDGATPLLGVAGAVLLVGYAAVQSSQPSGFGRTYAAYAGIFLVGALAWGWLVDRTAPDRFDLIGGAVVLVGALTILLGRRVA